MKSLKNPLLILAAVYALTGCAGTVFDTYHEPVDGPIATLHFDLESALKKRMPPKIGFWKNSRCDVNPSGTSGGVPSNPDLVDIDGVKSVGWKIPAMPDFTLSFSMVDGNGFLSCNISLSFDPQPNAVYMAHFDVVDGVCVAKIDKVITSNDSKTLMPDLTVRPSTRECSL